MKTFRLLLLLVLFVIAGSLSGNAQALVQKDFRWFLKTNDGIYPSVETMAVFTPSGNILHKQVFMVDTDDPIVPEKGVNKISFITWVYYEGYLWTMVDVEGMVYPDGKCVIIFHSNGAGTETPLAKNK